MIIGRPFSASRVLSPTYLASLNENARDRIRDALKARLVPNSDGSIAMTARAWAIQGMV